MFDLANFSIEKIKEESDYGMYEVGPFPSGYGVTLGNILRRILLSSVPGASITSVKIDGVKHEYASLTGVSDDILQLLMKIKKIPVISHSDEPQVVTLKVKGKKVVTAKDIQASADIEFPNPDYEITELTASSASLNAEITIERSIGYHKPDESKRKELGLLPVDPDFNPVTRVSVRVEKTRVGQETNLDKVILEIYTNGAISPWISLGYSVRHFQTLANRMMDVFEGEIPMEETKQVAQVEAVKGASDELDIDKLNLSTRLRNALDRAGYKNLTLFAGMSKSNIYEIPRMGEKSANELFDLLKEYKIDITEE